MTLIRPLCMFTQTNVRWKRLFCTIEPASAVELITRIATPAAATHQNFFAFIVYPFPDCSPAADGVGRPGAVTFLPRRTVPGIGRGDHSPTARSVTPAVSAACRGGAEASERG